MTLTEAKEWFRGKRSTCYHVTDYPLETRTARVAEADAAMLQQAYWVLKAHKEG